MTLVPSKFEFIISQILMSVYLIVHTTVIYMQHVVTPREILHVPVSQVLLEMVIIVQVNQIEKLIIAVR